MILPFHLIVGSFVMAQPVAAKQIDWTTVYLQEPIGRAHQLRLKGELGGEGTVYVDPNKGELDAFGEPTKSTELVVIPIRVTFRETTTEKPKAGYRTYDVVGVGRSMPPLRLVISPKGQAGRLLVLDAKGLTTRVISMELVP
jgi:hypothetical protein